MNAITKPGLTPPGKASQLARIVKQNEALYEQNKAIATGVGLILAALTGQKVPVPNELWVKLGIEVTDSRIHRV